MKTYTLKWEFIKKNSIEKNCLHAKPAESKYCPECGKPVGVTDYNEAIMKRISENTDARAAINPNGATKGETVWNSDQTFLRELSDEISNVLFTLFCDSKLEKSQKKYFLNGTMEIAEAKMIHSEPSDEFKSRIR